MYQVEAAVSSAGVNGTSVWRAVLKPQPAGDGAWTFTAACAGCAPADSIVLERVVFGSVFFCSGRAALGLIVSRARVCVLGALGRVRAPPLAVSLPPRTD
jgi:hypothetical protein